MSNRSVNAVLLAGTIAFLVFLFVIEAVCAALGLPSISARLHDLQANGGEIFVVWGAFTVGLLFGHWWAGVSS